MTSKKTKIKIDFKSKGAASKPVSHKKEKSIKETLEVIKSKKVKIAPKTKKAKEKIKHRSFLLPVGAVLTPRTQLIVSILLLITLMLQIYVFISLLSLFETLSFTS